MLSPGGGEFAGILVGVPAAQGTVTTAAALSPGGAEALRVRGRRCDFILYPPPSSRPAAGGTLRVPVTQTAVYTRAPSLMAEGWTDVHASSSTPPPVSRAPPGHPAAVCVRACVSVCSFCLTGGARKAWRLAS